MWPFFLALSPSLSLSSPLFLSSFLSCSPASVSVILLTARLLAHDHPADVDVVVVEDVLGFSDGGDGEASGSAQDPGEVHVEQPQDVSAGVDQRCVVVVSGQDPVWRVGQHWRQQQSS